MTFYFLEIQAFPTADSENAKTHGEYRVAVVVRADSEADATEKSKAAILKAENLTINEVQQCELMTPEIMENIPEDYQELFVEAEKQGISLEFNIAPRYSVYYKEYELTSQDDSTDATKSNKIVGRVWVSNIAFDDGDPFEEDFWSEARLKQFDELVTPMFAQAGFEVSAEIVSEPFEYRAIQDSDDLEFFEAAESDGICILCYHDNPEQE